jgi:hypothetical protein
VGGGWGRGALPPPLPEPNPSLTLPTQLQQNSGPQQTVQNTEDRKQNTE